MNIPSIRAEALSLPTDDRAKLALALIESLDDLAPSEIEQIWLDEASRRAQQLDDGSVESIPGDEVAAQARGLLRR
jgi:putative addiction module component (TIGR02574 family)